LRLYRAKSRWPLSDVLPIIENLGLRVRCRRAFSALIARCPSGGFTSSSSPGAPPDLGVRVIRERFEEAHLRRLDGPGSRMTWSQPSRPRRRLVRRANSRAVASTLKSLAASGNRVQPAYLEDALSASRPRTPPRPAVQTRVDLARAADFVPAVIAKSRRSINALDQVTRSMRTHPAQLPDTRPQDVCGRITTRHCLRRVQALSRCEARRIEIGFDAAAEASLRDLCLQSRGSGGAYARRGLKQKVARGGIRLVRTQEDCRAENPRLMKAQPSRTR